jgi:hypothetical protein
MVQYPELSMESTAKLGSSTAALNSPVKTAQEESGDQIKFNIFSGKDETPREGLPIQQRAKTQVQSPDEKAMQEFLRN